jgi:hypothetical protein
MIALEPVIQVRELPPARARLRQHLPSIQELVGSSPSAQEPSVLTYLSQGAVCGIYNDRGLVFDVIQTGRRLDVESQHDPHLSALNIQPNLLLTDGTWVWSGVLPYYVAVYHLRLPARFLQYAEKRQWKIEPTAIRLDDLNWDAYDAVPDVTAGVNL